MKQSVLGAILASYADLHPPAPMAVLMLSEIPYEPTLSWSVCSSLLSVQLTFLLSRTHWCRGSSNALATLPTKYLRAVIILDAAFVV